MSSITVRISKVDKQIIDELGDRLGESTRSIIHQAIEEYRRRRLLDAANKGYAKLRENQQEWEEELEERSAWDETIADGIE